MNLLFTVCGRAGSKGIKGKNFKEFLGHPLLFYTFAAIVLYQDKHSEHHIDVAFNTDSPEMIDMIKENRQINALLVPRKEDLAGDKVAKKLVILDTLNEIEKLKRVEYDLVVDLDITSPLRTVEDIEAIVNKAKTLEYDVVFSVVDARRNPYFNMVKENEDGTVSLVCPSEYTARQQCPPVYDMDASMYAYKPTFLRSDTMLLAGKCGVVKRMDIGMLDLDHESDFEYMQIIANYLIFNKNNHDLKNIYTKIMDLEMK